MSVSKFRNDISLLKSGGAENWTANSPKVEQSIITKKASKNRINFRVKSGLSDHAQSLNAR